MCYHACFQGDNLREMAEKEREMAEKEKEMAGQDGIGMECAGAERMGKTWAL